MLTMLQMILQNYLYRLKMSNPYEQFRQAIMGGLPIDNAVSFDQFQDARLSGLLKSLQPNPQLMNDMSNVSQQINQQQVDKNLKEQKRKERRQALEDIAARFGIINAQQSGNYQQANIMQNNLLERQKARVAEQERINQLQKFNSMVKGTEFEDIANALGEEQAMALYGQMLAKAFTAKPDKPPAIVQEYEYAKAQGFEGSFEDFLESKKSQTNINTGVSGFQQSAVTKYNNNMSAAEDANAINTSLDTLDNLLNEGVNTGFGSGLQLGLQKIGQFFLGEDYKVPEVAGKEQFVAETTKLILPLVKQLGVNPTDKDLDFVKSGALELSKSEAGNRLMLQALRLQQARRIDEHNFDNNFYNENPNATIFQRNIAFSNHKQSNPDLYTSKSIEEAYKLILSQTNNSDVIDTDTESPF